MSKETTQECKERWQKMIKKHLIGRKITDVEYFSESEIEDAGWRLAPCSICLDNEIWLTPLMDDAGNEGGAMATTIDSMRIIPVIR